MTAGFMRSLDLLVLFDDHDGFVAQIASSKDSLCESSVLAGGHEQLDPYEVQDPELGRV
jgi:hypothetical protein